jgi:hypothetical protein
MTQCGAGGKLPLGLGRYGVWSVTVLPSPISTDGTR